MIMDSFSKIPSFLPVFSATKNQSLEPTRTDVRAHINTYIFPRFWLLQQAAQPLIDKRVSYARTKIILKEHTKRKEEKIL